VPQETRSPPSEGKAPSHDPAGDTAASFEDAVQRLGLIVEQLENGDLPLEESLDLFEEGVKLAKQSQARLDAAERRVEKLLGIDSDGKPVVEVLKPEPT
jgi:exodeoxyribonuclease VII small subunit